MSHPSDDQVLRGTRRLLRLRAADLAAGDTHLGWKAAFGSPGGLSALGIDRPLVGYLTHSRRLVSGTSISLEHWTRPVLEAEVAVHLIRDVAAGTGAEEVRKAIGGLSAAIELADLDPPPSDLEVVLGGNIFHRHVLVAERRVDRDDLAGITARVTRDGVEVARADDPEALTGGLHDVLVALADRLAAAGELLRAGDLVIAGSMVPPLEVAAGQVLRVEVAGLGDVEVSLR